MIESPSDGPSRGLLLTALATVLVAVVAVLVVAALRNRSSGVSPVAIAAAPAPEAGSPECTRLLAALPDHLGAYDAAPAVAPAPVGARAWRAGPDSDAVILRCGVERPAEFVAGTPLQLVDGVAWFRIGGTGSSTWILVDRPVYVALTLPDGCGPTPIQVVSDMVSATLPVLAPRPGAA